MVLTNHKLCNTILVIALILNLLNGVGSKLEASEICKVLAAETRLKIIQLLKTKGPLGAKDIACFLGVTTAAISQHLKIMSQVGIVSSERKGFCIPYTINEDVLRQCRQLLSEVCLCGCS
ncbi:MAG TPA: hypothetical protein DDW65_23750, partial [Firmicutes bacterium]|nr:hypothetical protein [Bacillota bacterium]